MNADAWGEAPFEQQFMLAAVSIDMTLIHFDPTVLDVCLMESMGGAPAIGALSRAGSRLGNNLPRFAASNTPDANGIVRSGNHFIGLNIASPVQGKPFRFYYSYLASPPVSIPLGTEKSAVRCSWVALPYTQDPWGGGLGAQGAIIWDNTLDS